ncbi:MAG: response regulator transcription factor [Verrucomicrobiales bacterium]|nr:response regulator transcription factor [Verrucomicrobiales bacterium]
MDQANKSEAVLKVLVVDDEQDIRELVGMNLKRQGFAVSLAADGIAALEVARREMPDVVVLDLMLPGKDGFQVFKEMKADQMLEKTPVIMLTAKGELNDKIQGLELGADDYMTKPFSPKELVLRLKAVLKRTSRVVSESSLVEGSFRLERDRLNFFLDGEPVMLTATEFKLLRLLVEAAGKTQERDYLLREVWGYNDSTMTRTLDTHIKRLREKLGNRSTCVQTVRGVGYRFSPN